MTIDIFLLLMLACSLLTGLTTEGVKKLLDEAGKTYKSNALAGIIALILGGACGSAFIFFSHLGWTSENIVTIVILCFFSWLCSMVGYDKVIQTINQILGRKKVENDESKDKNSTT